MRRVSPAVGAAAFVLEPGSAAAHGTLQGVGDFYASLLHPLVVPAELLALVAIALLLGGSGVRACRLGLPALVLGLSAGLLVGHKVPEDMSSPLLLGMAMTSGALVASAVQPPIALLTALAAVAGLAVGIDAAPEAGALRPILVASVATVLGGSALATTVIALVLGREVHWQRVAARTAGSWIAACSILYFTWLLVPR